MHRTVPSSIQLVFRNLLFARVVAFCSFLFEIHPVDLTLHVHGSITSSGSRPSNDFKIIFMPNYTPSSNHLLGSIIIRAKSISLMTSGGPRRPLSLPSSFSSSSSLSWPSSPFSTSPSRTTLLHLHVHLPSSKCPSSTPAQSASYRINKQAAAKHPTLEWWNMLLWSMILLCVECRGWR